MIKISPRKPGNRILGGKEDRFSVAGREKGKI
jgi:hypothetical protein